MLLAAGQVSDLPQKQRPLLASEPRQAEIHHDLLAAFMPTGEFQPLLESRLLLSVRGVETFQTGVEGLAHWIGDEKRGRQTAHGFGPAETKHGFGGFWPLQDAAIGIHHEYGVGCVVPVGVRRSHGRLGHGEESPVHFSCVKKPYPRAACDARFAGGKFPRQTLRRGSWSSPPTRLIPQAEIVDKKKGESFPPGREYVHQRCIRTRPGRETFALVKLPPYDLSVVRPARGVLRARKR